MSFYSKSFSYGGESSESYNIQIASIDSSGTVTSPPSGNIELIRDWIYRREKPFFYGIRFTEGNKFPVTFFSENEITALDYGLLEFWLFNRQSYEDLAIAQPDMDSAFWKCIFVDPQSIRVGNLVYGIQGTAVCDSPFMYEYPRTDSYAYTDPTVASTITFFNTSHYRGYLRPTISFTMNSTGGNFSITNVSDSNRLFSFTGLSPYETMTVNNDLGIVDSSLDIPRLSTFNKYFLRLIPGVNILNIAGNISSLSITYQFYRRMGG